MIPLIHLFYLDTSTTYPALLLWEGPLNPHNKTALVQHKIFLQAGKTAANTAAGLQCVNPDKNCLLVHVTRGWKNSLSRNREEANLLFSFERHANLILRIHVVPLFTFLRQGTHSNFVRMTPLIKVILAALEIGRLFHIPIFFSVSLIMGIVFKPWNFSLVMETLILRYLKLSPF